MGHLGGLTGLSVTFNPHYLGKWPEKIGVFILNFAAIEMISYHYLDALEATRGNLNQNFGQPLGSRIARIRKLVAALPSLSAEAKQHIDLLWQEASEGSKWRNRIAHNPVLPSWNQGNDPSTQPPDLIGIPDMKQAKLSDKSNSLSLDGLEMLSNHTADLAERLQAAAAALKEA